MADLIPFILADVDFAGGGVGNLIQTLVLLCTMVCGFCSLAIVGWRWTSEIEKRLAVLEKVQELSTKSNDTTDQHTARAIDSINQKVDTLLTKVAAIESRQKGVTP